MRTILPLNPEINFEQMDKLEELLKEHDIPYERERHFDGWRIAVPSKKGFERNVRSASIILFNGSYGHRDGLLEIYAPHLNKGVEGYLNAEEALSYVQDTLKGISRNSNG